MSSATTSPSYLTNGPHMQVDVQDQSRNDYMPRPYGWTSADPTQVAAYNAALASQNYGSYAQQPVNGTIRGAVESYAPHQLDLSLQYDRATLAQRYALHQGLAAGYANVGVLAPEDPYQQQYPVTMAQHFDPSQYYQHPSAPVPTSVTEHLSQQSTVLPTPHPTRSTLHFTDLEPWMDPTYFERVCKMMDWENIILKITRIADQQLHGYNIKPNNPGFCYMTFPTTGAAQAALLQLTSSKPPPFMPNSKRPFSVTWATVPASSARSTRHGASPQTVYVGLFAIGSLYLLNGTTPPVQKNMQPPSDCRDPRENEEFSIFVGDLAPETTNADLILVFKDPIRGLRHDREPKFVAPFPTCKSAKIMVDKETGTSKGYGFVRFGSAPDAQRALIEMQGLYCLSRPMRISQATAKSKSQGHGPQAYIPAHDSEDLIEGAGYSIPHIPASMSSDRMYTPGTEHDRPSSTGSGGSAKVNGQHSSPYSKASMDEMETKFRATIQQLNTDPGFLDEVLKLALAGSVVQAKPDGRGHMPQSAPPTNMNFATLDGRGTLAGHPNNRSFSHSAVGSNRASPVTNAPSQANVTEVQKEQTRAVLSNMIGSNGGLLNSGDPYNTTVFVGGLSGLISEDVLRSFFVPFGDIHYVKIPPGKGCGFVQFVRKADAEQAIRALQGMVIGGGRVRLSWGRSQYKALQAAAQSVQVGVNAGQLADRSQVTPDAHNPTLLLQQLGLVSNEMASVDRNTNFIESANGQAYIQARQAGAYDVDHSNAHGLTSSTSTTQGQNEVGQNGVHISRSQTFPTFTPFAGDIGNLSPGDVAASVVSGSNGSFQQGAVNGVVIHNLSPSAVRTQHGMDALRNGLSGTGGLAFFDGAQHVTSNGYQQGDVSRQGRSGSESTTTTSTADVSPPPQHAHGKDIYDLGNGLAGLNLRHSQSPTYENGAFHQQAEGGPPSHIYNGYVNANNTRHS